MFLGNDIISANYDGFSVFSNRLLITLLSLMFSLTAFLCSNVFCLYWFFNGFTAVCACGAVEGFRFRMMAGAVPQVTHIHIQIPFKCHTRPGLNYVINHYYIAYINDIYMKLHLYLNTHTNTQ